MSWVIWIAALGLAFRTELSQGYIAGLLLLGLVPYLVSIHLVEPWLEKRARKNANVGKEIAKVENSTRPK
jgi:hypothetical protein